MIPSDVTSVLTWWLVLFILGTGFLPLTLLLFKNFFDKGYIFSKILALCLLSYSVFIFGVLRLIPFTQVSSYFLFSLLILIQIAFIPDKKNLLKSARTHAPLFLFEELLFLGALFFWAYIHSFSPDIHGLEKYMDFGFVNSILRSEFFPPRDMWFTPFSINYYYFGHLMTALLTKLSGIPSNITFNLMLSTLFALCLTQTFSLGANLYHFLQKSGGVSWIKRVIAGLLTASLVTFAGNLHILYAFFKPYENDKPQPFWELVLNIQGYPNAYWYPNATRFIYNTIHEFPIYSWVVADLHGHVLDIPIVLLTIAVLLSLFMKSEIPASPAGRRNPKSETSSIFQNTKFKIFSGFDIRISNLVLIGFLLAVMYMTNAWDGGIYLLLSGLVLISLAGKRLKGFLIAMGIIALSLAAFAFPYNYFFKPFASGIGILCSPEFLTNMGKIGPFLFEKNYCQHSPWWQLLTLYGFFYFFVISYLFFVSRIKKLLASDIFVLLLIALSTVLIIIPEFIYLKDIYPAHYRANTMFKLVFQSFIMLSISAAYIIVRILSFVKIRTLSVPKTTLLLVFLICTTALVSLVLLYPYRAINSYYGLDQKDEQGERKKPSSLDGLSYLKTLYPSDYEGILWLNKNVAGQPVILEAQGDSYTDFARVSANTGLPTVLGWTVHEWLWRGSYDIPSPRIAEITTMYETTDVNTARKLLEKHKVAYVFVGTLEYQKYPALSEGKFQSLGEVAYQNQNTKIYKLYR
jgi:uncharacterized membrane protein